MTDLEKQQLIDFAKAHNWSIAFIQDDEGGTMGLMMGEDECIDMFLPEE